MKKKSVILTFDIDWAPDFIIKEIAEVLIKKNIPSVWFVTHESEILNFFRSYPDLFELGIHPNFSPNSTQGNNFNEVMLFLKDLVPEARCMRSHGLIMSSNWLLASSKEYNIQFDFSCFLPYAKCIEPHVFFYKDMSIIRLPYNWEDDIDMFTKNPFNLDLAYINNYENFIFDFHPIHIGLNSNNLDSYLTLLSLNKNVKSWTKKDIFKNRNKEIFGVNDFFTDLLDHQKFNFYNIDAYLNELK